MELILNGIVVGVEATRNGAAQRVFIQAGGRSNVLVMVPPGAKHAVSEKLSLPVRARVERTRDGAPTPIITYWARDGWPERARAAAVPGEV